MRAAAVTAFFSRRRQTLEENGVTKKETLKKKNAQKLHRSPTLVCKLGTCAGARALLFYLPLPRSLFERAEQMCVGLRARVCVLCVREKKTPRIYVI